MMKTVTNTAFVLCLAAATLGAGPSATAQSDDSHAISPAPVSAEPTSAEPTVRMPRDVIEAASAYETFIGRATAINAAFVDGRSILFAMSVAESYQPEQMDEGVIAYGAVIALQDQRFVAAVRAAGAGPDGGAALARAVLEDPRRATALPGAQGAAARINATLAEQAEHLSQTGRQVKQSAYDVQHQAWSRQTVADGAARLAQAKALSANRFSPTAQDVARLFQTAAALRADAAAVEVVGSGFTPAVDHALALAALAILGRADQEDIKAASLLREPEGAGCMQMSKLNLYQCLAVAGPHYEDIFCLGEHALKETGQCLRQVAGAPARASAIPRAPVTNDYAVPVAYASADPR